MARYKWITVKKPNGGRRKQKVKVLANGKYRFVKNTTKRRTTKKVTKRKRRTTRRKTTKKRRRKRSIWNISI